MDQPHVSILESDQAIAQSLARTLQAEGFPARTCGSAREFMA
jgi:DNA-binding response OmpR family regulator